jgi:nucleotidyltransferase/DNA polymerase involved in DNA repair
LVYTSLAMIRSERAWPRIVAHADMDAFYAAVEQLDDPALRGRPVLVGPRSNRGVVLTASYEARPFGVGSAMPMAKACRLCPNALIVPPRFDRYQEVSAAIMSVFCDFSPDVEALSLDEAFLDMTGTKHLFGDPQSIGRRLKEAVRDATGGLTASVGLSAPQYVAKVASASRKPDGLTVVPPEEARAWLAPLPVSRLWGAGPKTQARLHLLGCTLSERWLIPIQSSFSPNLGEPGSTSTRSPTQKIPGRLPGVEPPKALDPNIRSTRTCVTRRTSNFTFVDPPIRLADA